MNRIIGFISDEVLCLLRQDRRIPESILEMNVTEYQIFKDENEAKIKLSEILTFDQVYAFGAEDGIQVNTVYTKNDRQIILP